MNKRLVIMPGWNTENLIKRTIGLVNEEAFMAMRDVVWGIPNYHGRDTLFVITVQIMEEDGYKGLGT
jgi:hypothetical protein